MKILWFTNTISGLNIIDKQEESMLTGTWMAAIIEAFSNNVESVELGIAFNSYDNLKNLVKNGISFFPIYNIHKRNKLSRVLSRARNKVIWYDYITIYQRIIDDFKPDLIHVFGTEEPFGLISKFTDIPVVVSIQGNLTVYAWKYFSGLDKRHLFTVDSLKSRLAFLNYSAVYNHFHKRAIREREIFKSLKYIIGRTDWDRRVAKALAPQTFYYYNDEVLREEFYNTEPVQLTSFDVLKIFTMTGPAVYKGLEVICKAASIMNEIGIDFSWEIGGVYENSALVRAVKKKLKKDYPLKNIFYLGQLNVKNIIEAMKNSNLYVMPSHIENGSIVLSEAMILGLPVITTLAGGTSSRLQDKTEGLMIQDGDPWSLTGAILEMKSNLKLAKEYGENARKRALKRHDKQYITDQLIQIYDEIINSEKNTKIQK